MAPKEAYALYSLTLYIGAELYIIIYVRCIDRATSVKSSTRTAQICSGKLNYIFLSMSGIWTELPALNPLRAQHGCALVELNGEKGVLVAGGDSGGTRLNDVRYK